VYGALQNSALTVSNGQEQRTLTVDRHAKFHAELPEGFWKIVAVAPKDRNYVQIGQEFQIRQEKGPSRSRFGCIGTKSADRFAYFE
jgi:hypothetical protein